MATIIVNPDRADKARYIYTNTGGIRFDMVKGPFTYDDNFIVSPFRDAFFYVPDVPYDIASTLLDKYANSPSSLIGSARGTHAR
jgi:hypothetical protein